MEDQPVIMTSQTNLDVTTLRAVIGRIIPADHDPGALDLGADHYVVAQLSAPECFGAAVSLGLAELDALAIVRAGCGFAELPSAQQDEVLVAHQQTEWFAALAELTAEGFYADPANGGNRDALSWQMIGYHHRLPEGPNGPMSDAATEAGNDPRL